MPIEKEIKEENIIDITLEKQKKPEKKYDEGIWKYVSQFLKQKW